MNPREGNSTDRATLAAIARRAMIERGPEPDFPPPALQELATIDRSAGAADNVREMRDMLFHPPVEGKLEHGFQGLDVGDHVHAKLVHPDF